MKSLMMILLLALCGTCQCADIVIESRPEGKNHSWYKETEGKWIDSDNPKTAAKSSASGLTPSETCGSRKTLLGPAVASVRWQPVITEPGKYNVYATWPLAANAAGVVYVIKHADGETSKSLDQYGWGAGPGGNANKWIFIGAYNFKADAEQYVDQIIPGEAANAVDVGQTPQAYADAMRFSTEEIPGASEAGVIPQVTNAQPETILIESRLEGKNFDRYRETSGSWIDSSGKSMAPGLSDPDTCGTRKTAVAVKADGTHAGPASAQFLPKLTGSAHYHVYATWPRQANAAPVTYVISHATGQEVRTVDQDGWGVKGRSTADQWVAIGDYDFKAGEDQFVELRHTGKDVGKPDQRNLGQIIADAVLFSSKPIEEMPEFSPSGGKKTPPKPSSTATVSRPVTWLTDIVAARDTAQRQNKKILLFFFSPDSVLSQEYDNTIFRDSSVQSILNEDYVAVRLNHQENRELANSLLVFKAGTLMIFGSDGKGLKKIEGRKSASDVARELR